MDNKIKIWVAEFCPAYEQGSVLGLFSTQEKAEAAVAEDLKGAGIAVRSDYSVCEYTVDEAE